MIRSQALTWDLKKKKNSDEREKVGKRGYSKLGNNISKGTGTENLTRGLHRSVTESPSTGCEEGSGERWRDEAEKEMWGPGPGVGSERNSE